MTNTFNKKEVKEENYFKKPQHGPYTFLCGLVLIILAIGLYGYRTGVFSRTKYKMSGEEYFTESVMDEAKSGNSYALSQIYAIAEKASENNGVISEETEIKVKLEIPEMIFMGMAIPFPTPVTQEFSYFVEVRQDGIWITNENLDNTEIAHFETQGFDLSKLGSKSYVKTKAVNKLLVKYEKMFLEELTKSGITKNLDYINDINSVVTVDTELAFSFDRETLQNAAKVCLEAAKKDRTLKKAFEYLYEGDLSYNEYIESMEESCSFENINSLYGSIYVNEGEGIVLRDITLDGFTEDEEGNREPVVLQLKAGYSYYAGNIGYICSLTANEQQMVNVSLKGTLDKAIKTISAEGTAFLRNENGADTQFNFVLSELQMVSSGNSNYLNGFASIIPETEGYESINLVFGYENRKQQIEGEILYSDGQKGTISVVIDGK